MEPRNPLAAAVLAWLVPGAGHLLQGRLGKALLYFVCVGGLYGYGLWLGTGKIVYYRWDQKEWSWPYLAQCGVGAAALPALNRDTTSPSWDDALDQLHREKGRDIDLARLFTIVAGLLNMLVIFDAFAGPALKNEEARLLLERRNSQPAGGKP